MANNAKYTLQFDAQLNISQIKGNLATLQQSLSKLSVPDKILNPLTKDIAKLETELKNFEVLSSKDQLDQSGMKALLTSYERIDKLVKSINIDIKTLEGTDIAKLLPNDILTNFQKLSELLSNIQELSNFKTDLPNQIAALKVQADAAKQSVEELDKELKQLEAEKEQLISDQATRLTDIADINSKLAAAKKIITKMEAPYGKDSQEYKKNEDSITSLVNKITDAKNKVESLEAKLATLRSKNSKSQDVDLLPIQIESKKNEIANLEQQLRNLQQIQNELAQAKNPLETSEYQEAKNAVETLTKQLLTLQADESAYTSNLKAKEKAIRETNAAYEEQKNIYEQLASEIARLTAAETDTTKLDEIRNKLAQIMGVDISQIPTDLDRLKEIIAQMQSGNLESVKSSLAEVQTATDDLTQSTGQLTQATNDQKESNRAYDDQLRDVSALKSRIQYFFGLANSINLVKRAIRGAFNTIKELDKAMTETAVVTDFSVSDMWAQLPEYTKRANELGVTTLAAYEAATLYYQQGLKTNEVAALSVETLKMARIAGLDAAEATDRMTNALRGFNMALTETNAQRVDDVYSELAANTASNVDEISTAMTKVASLAHNANMEFETTAAFLAQIIETTRESAETAGTALKTVVARFSEVKKLYSEDELRGTDEEGQVIDVNKISKALRTAGIDLNKYFLGEVGLDEIFMELASKWDSLTQVQQRYIATQAAGSRQQSRFIALMSDYARTQELVGKAYSSAGASERQFEKTQESLESKLNRLKNAWNEFLMGLTNNVVVKKAVDLLTDLLNTINNLTSVFGESGGTIAKWATVVGGIFAGKALFKDAGIVDNILSGFLGKKGEGTQTIISGLKERLGGIQLDDIFNFEPIDFKQIFAFSGRKEIDSLRKSRAQALLLGDITSADAIADKLQRGLGGLTPDEYVEKFGGAWGDLTGIGDFFEGIEEKITTFKDSIVATIPKIKAFFSAFSGGAGIVLATFAVLTAAIAGMTYYIETKKAEFNNPLETIQKQIDQAKEFQSIVEKTNTEAQTLANTWKQVQDQQKTNLQAIKDATSIKEQQQAIQNQNDYIESLLEKDATYAQYISKFTDLNGEIVLTLDEEKLAEAADKAAEAAVKASVAVRMAGVQVQYDTNRQLQALIDQIDDVYSVEEGANGPIYKKRGPIAENVVVDGQIQYGGAGITTISAEEYNTQMGYRAQYEAQIDRNNREMIASVTQAFAEIAAQDNTISSENINLISSTLGQAFNNSTFWKAIEDETDAILKQEDSITRAQYSALYNVSLDSIEKIDIKQIAQGVALAQRTELQPERITALDEFIKGDELARQVVTAFNGEVELTINADSLEKLAELQEALGLNPDEFAQQFVKAQQQYAAVKGRSMERYAGVINTTENGQRKINSDWWVNNLANLSLSAEDWQQIAASAEQIANLGAPSDYEAFLSKLPYVAAESKENLQEIYAFLYKFNLDNPIQAFAQLEQAEKQAAETGNKALAELVTHIQDLNKDLFSAGSLFQNFVTSSDYDELTEKLDDFIKENNKITADNVNELAKSYKSLQTILTKDEISAKGLAKALTLLQTDNLPLESFNTTLLSVLSNITSVQESVQELHDFISNFDKGTDYFEGINFFLDNIETLTSDLDNFNVGQGSQTQTLYDSIFGEGAFASLNKDPVERAKAALENINKVKDLISDGIQGFMETFSDSGLLDITEIDLGNGLVEFNWNFGDKTQEEIIEDIKAAWLEKYPGLNISDELAQSILQAWFGKDTTAEGELNENAFKKGLNTLIQDASQTGILDYQQVEALGKSLGLDPDTIKKLYRDALQQLDRDAGRESIPIQVDWATKDGKPLTGSDLIDYFNRINQDLRNRGFGGIVLDGDLNVDETIAKLQELGLSYDQAVEILNNAVAENEATLQKATGIYDENGNEIVVSANTVAEALAKANQEISDFQSRQDFSRISESVDTSIRAGVVSGLSTVNEEALNPLKTAINTAVSGGASSGVIAGANSGSSSTSVSYNLQSAAYNGTYNGLVAAYDAFSQELAANPLTVTIKTTQGATGGIVSSYAKGTQRKISPGLGLTGEEAPEIIWNKNAGYAYITGSNGPAFQNLQPGDQIFNAADTQKILRNTNSRDYLFKSYGTGAYKRAGTGGTTSSSQKTKKSWRNELDWLYDLVADIAEEEHQQSLIQKDYEYYLKDIESNGRQLYELTKRELNSLEKQLLGQEQILQGRQQQLQETYNAVISDTTNFGAKNAPIYLRDYVGYNDEDQTVEINWDLIEAIKNQDTYDQIASVVKDLEDTQNLVRETEETIADIKSQIQSLQDKYLQKYIDFENRVKEAVVNKYQTSIDNLKELNDVLKDSNSAILDSIQKEIELERQIRDNTDTEADISNMEQRLAYLQRDTTGANALEIQQLQKELADARRDYSDTLIDQSIERLSDLNEASAKQRDKQIELMQAQLQYWEESGGLWQEVKNLIQEGFNTVEGTILDDTQLYQILKDKESWSSLSQAQQDKWARDLILATNEVGAYLIQMEEGLGGDLSDIKALLAQYTSELGGTPLHSTLVEANQVEPRITRYASGGLNTYTGLAQLHGTPSEPEYVLNARQTDAFLRLADVLPEVIGTSSTVNNSYGGNLNLNITMNVDEIGSDYDVDRIVDRVKEVIYDTSSYRNINVLNFTR